MVVTRVNVVGQADDDGNRSVEATLNGETKYGIRQPDFIAPDFMEGTTADEIHERMMNELPSDIDDMWHEFGENLYHMLND